MQMRWRLAVLAVATIGVGGCATYVNIPEQTGDIASHDANHQTVLQVQEVAIKAAADASAWRSTYTFRTLPNTEPRHYLAMAPRLGQFATVDDTPGAPKLEVRQVYIRGSKAQVDLVRTAAPGQQPTALADPGLILPAPELQDPRQVVTAYLKWDPISGWNAHEVKVWRMPVEQALGASARQSETNVTP